MASSVKVPLLRKLPVQVNIDDENSTRNCVYVADLVTLLSAHKSPSDVYNIRPDNIVRELRGYKNVGVQLVHDKHAVPVSSVFRYFFTHMDSFSCCRKACEQIEQLVYGNKSTESTISTIKQFYRTLCEKFPKNSYLYKELCNSVVLTDVPPSLHTEYKDDFSKEDWWVITYFEHHFCKEVNIHNLSYEEELNMRHKFLLSCIDTKEIGDICAKQYKGIIIERMRRRAEAERDNGILIYAPNAHVPVSIEVDIISHLDKMCSINLAKIVVFDCTKSSCGERQGIHVFVEFDEGEGSVMANDIANQVNHVTVHKHNIVCHSVVFVTSLDLYKGDDAQVLRFQLRDDYIQRTLANLIIHVWQPVETLITESIIGECTSCFGVRPLKPLDWHSLDIVAEWSLDVPIRVQIWFDTFVNKSSIRKSKIPAGVLKSKITRLYATFDVLLNTFNKNYCGILQQLNTKELVMNYHSAKTIFSVTSSSGATQGIDAAEREL